MFLFSCLAYYNVSYFDPQQLDAHSVDDLNDIFSFLRTWTGQDNLSDADVVTIGGIPRIVIQNEAPDVQGKMEQYVLLYSPLVRRESRFVSAMLDKDYENTPAYKTFDFHKMRVTLSSYSFYYDAWGNSPNDRYMRCWRLLGQVSPEEWEVIDEQMNQDINKSLKYHYQPKGSTPDYYWYWIYHYNVKHKGTYSTFRLENKCDDSYKGLYPRANAVTVSRVLFFGRIELGRIKLSPIKLDRKAQYVLNFGMFAAADVI